MGPAGMSAMSGMGQMPFMTPMMPQMFAAPMWAAPMPAQGQPQLAPPQPPAPPSAEYEKKITLLEKRLQDEREKVLLASLKSKEESEIASRVELSIKDVQDKLRRDRRESEMEEGRLKMEARVQELEARLAQERETWVHTLKTQMGQRELQDRDMEGQFTQRIQEIERRWLEEKAHWQRLVHAKDDELRQAKGVAEHLKAVDLDFQKLSIEKKGLEEKVSQLSQANAQMQVQSATGVEKEREAYRLRAEYERSQSEAHSLRERLERELQAAHSSSREREARLLADNEKLQGELLTVSQRLRAEHEAELRRIQAETDAEVKKAKAQADLAGAALQRMRAVAGALEKQTAALRVQAGQGHKLQEELTNLNERYKAEFLVLQRKWQDRETELRKQVEAEAEKRFDSEKTRLKVRSQEELQARVLAVQGQAREEMERALVDRQRSMRAAMEEEIARRLKLESEKLAQDLRASEQGRRKLEEDLYRLRQELARLQQVYDELRGRSAVDEEWRAAASRERAGQEKEVIALREKLHQVEESSARAHQHAEEESRRFAAMSAERDNWNRLKLAFEVQDKRRVQESEELKAQNARLQTELERCRGKES